MTCEHRAEMCIRKKTLGRFIFLAVRLFRHTGFLIQTVCCIKGKAYKNIFKQDGLFGQVCVRIKQLQIHTILPINTCSCDLMTSQFHIVQVRVFLGVGGSEEFISPP